MDGHAQTWSHKLDAIRMKPSEYFRRQCFVAMDPDDVCAPGLMRDIGSECLVWASDYPHTDHEFPGAVSSTLEILEAGPPGCAAAVLDSNPRRLYGLATS